MEPYMRYARHLTEIVAYTYEANVHCPACTVARFGPEPREGYAVTDSEGNTPKPVFLGDVEEPEVCGTCGTTCYDPF